MRLRTRLFITFCLFFIPSVYYLTAQFQNNLKFRYLEGVEEALVDQARILAGIVSQQMEQSNFSADNLGEVLSQVYRDSFKAQIYDLSKTFVDTRVYITDSWGILIFDSLDRDRPGMDYSLWRDVFLTLRGEYGARSSNDDPLRPAMSTLYVAAPVMVDSRIAGVLTIGKPTQNINDFLKTAKAQVLKRSVMAAVLALVLTVLALFFITRPLDRLLHYARNVAGGTDARPPDFGSSDLAEVGQAFDKIRADLAAKEYIEAYIQSLTHEIKSPVAAIAGAAELLQEEDVPMQQQKRFINNINTEARRIQTMVDRMLALSTLEHRQKPEQCRHIDLNEVISGVLERLAQEIEARQIRIITKSEKECTCMGDPFLINQAVMNLVQNAIDFSPTGQTIRITLAQENARVCVAVRDQGPGIPDFAKDKIFDRFFSIQRPDTSKKSTGLGLNFVREIALLHNGTVEVKNDPEGRGALAIFCLPSSAG